MSRHAVKSWLTAAFAAITIAGATAVPAHAATKVGPLDQYGQIKPYCQNVVFSDMAAKWNVSATPDDAFNPYTWKCRYGTFIQVRALDMNAACRWAYKRGDVYAQTWNKSWAWSWDCWRR